MEIDITIVLEMTNAITIMCSARCNKEKEELEAESRIYRVHVH